MRISSRPVRPFVSTAQRRVTETNIYDSAGNLDLKAGVDLNYNDATHQHAVTHIGSTQKYWYDQNGSQTTHVVNGQTFTLGYDAENRLVSVSGAATASFVYDGDGRRVKSTVNGTTTYFIGAHYELTGSQVTKYYGVYPELVEGPGPNVWRCGNIRFPKPWPWNTSSVTIWVRPASQLTTREPKSLR